MHLVSKAVMVDCVTSVTLINVLWREAAFFPPEISGSSVLLQSLLQNMEEFGAETGGLKEKFLKTRVGSGWSTPRFSAICHRSNESVMLCKAIPEHFLKISTYVKTHRYHKGMKIEAIEVI